MRRLLFPFILVAIFACSISANDGGMGTLAGTVVAASGSVIRNAHVTLQGADGSAPEATATNNHGRFFFPELPHGYYDVRAYSGGSWSEWKHNIEVKTGKQTDVVLKIAPKSK
jgi:hypothetical protein